MIAEGKDVESVVLDEYVTRKILLHKNSMMLVQFEFKKGGVGEPHSHEEHEQIGYIAEGVFEVTVGGETKTLARGDSYYAGRNEVHGVVALADGIIIDTFTPIREDFLQPGMVANGTCRAFKLNVQFVRIEDATIPALC